MWFLFAQSTPDDVLGPLLALAGLAGVAGVAWAVFRVKGTQATIDLLEQSVRIERAEREALEARCRRETAVLEGRIDALTHDFAQVIALAVVKEAEAVRKRDRPGPSRQ